MTAVRFPGGRTNSIIGTFTPHRFGAGTALTTTMAGCKKVHTF